MKIPWTTWATELMFLASSLARVTCKRNTGHTMLSFRRLRYVPRITGVAPDATLRVYKVFGKMDATTEDVLIDAFLKAYDDGVGACVRDQW